MKDFTVKELKALLRGIECADMILDHEFGEGTWSKCYDKVRARINKKTRNRKKDK